MQSFIQTLRVAASELDAKPVVSLETSLIQSQSNLIDLNIKESYLLDFVHLLSTATHEREMQTKVLTQLLVLLLCPPLPYTNESSIEVFTFVV